MSSRDPTFLSWSVTSILAIGTAKGGLLLYNKRTMKKQTILGKHSKKITNGVWNAAGILALGAEDKNITISSDDGEAIDQCQVRAEPEQIKFCSPGGGGGSSPSSGAPSTNEQQQQVLSQVGTHVSFVQKGKSIMLLNCRISGNISEQQFPDKYGQITSYEWVDHCLVLGFTQGNVIVIQAAPSGDKVARVY